MRSVTQALGEARRYVDAALMVGFGIFCLVLAGSSASTKPTIFVLVGLFAIGYGIYIALSSGGYVMPYVVYGLAVLGVLVFLFS